MKNATPERDKAILSTLNKIEKFQKGHLFIGSNFRNVYDNKSSDELLNNYNTLIRSVVNLYQNFLFDEQSLEKIKINYLLSLDNIEISDIGFLSSKIDILHKIVSKKLSKKEKTKDLIQGLKKPLKWEEITLTYTGDSIKVKQNSTALGVYSFADFGIPKITNKKTKSVPQFFMCLFFNKESEVSNFLLATDNSNQKNKGKLSQILQNVFDTNKDPIFIDKKSKLYTPLFKVIFGGQLRENNHRSGGSLYDETEPTLPNHTE